MRAKEFLNELFRPGKKWQWSFTGSEEAIAVFHVGDVPYQFHAYTYSENPTVWEVEFRNASRNIENRSSKFGLTGTGNSAEVMSTIADIMREFLQRYQGSISQLMFTADEPSRQRLYYRMAQRLLPDWELIQSGKNFTLNAPETVNEDSTMPASAGCIVVAEDTGRWCLQQRSDTVSDPGVWSTWGGGVEPGPWEIYRLSDGESARDLEQTNRNGAETEARTALGLRGEDPTLYGVRTRRQAGTSQQVGSFTGYWIVKDPQGREIHKFGGVGNVQADANRVALQWLQQNPRHMQAGVEVVPEMR